MEGGDVLRLLRPNHGALRLLQHEVLRLPTRPVLLAPRGSAQSHLSSATSRTYV